MRQRPQPVFLPVLAVLAAGWVLASCAGEKPTPIPAMPAKPAATLVPLPTSTRRPTATPAATSETPSVRRAETLLPLEPDAPIVQIARIGHSPWEPAILAQMSPHFSLQAKGFAVFQAGGGESREGWYQTALSSDQALGFVRLLVDEIGVLELARRRPAPTPAFATDREGRPVGAKAYGVLYVRTAEEEGRLVLTQEEIEAPTGADAARIDRLRDLLLALELWKSGVWRPFTPEQAGAIAAHLGWWTDLRAPYSPESAVAFGSLARARVPREAPVAIWPLEASLAETFDVPYGQTPAEVVLSEPENVVAVLTAAHDPPPAHWGPHWRDADGQTRHLVGIRPAVPGSNQTTLDYTFALAPRGLGLDR